MTIEDGVLAIENNDKVTIKDHFNTANFNKKTYRPVDDRTIQEIIDDQFIPIDDTTQQELEDYDYLSFESENEIDATSAWDDNKTTVSKTGLIYKLSTDYNKKVKAAEKIKKKIPKKKNW